MNMTMTLSVGFEKMHVVFLLDIKSKFQNDANSAFSVAYYHDHFE